MNSHELKISRARTHLLIDAPWFGSLALRLKAQAGQTSSIANNGNDLYYNEKFVSERSDAEMIGLMAHEVMHCALGHMFRGGTRDWRKWNEACDIAINGMLRAEGFTLPKGAFDNEEAQFKGMSAEQIYALRENNSQTSSSSGQQGNSGEPGSGEPDYCDMQPAPSEASQPGEAEQERMSEVDWQVAAEQVFAVAQKAGLLSGDTVRAIKQNKQSRTDWRTLLRRFLEQTTPSDYSWMRPNRRYIAQGIYMPGMVRENMPRIGLAIDTSGSIDTELLNQFAAELTAILHETRPESIDVVYCDSSVKAQESFSPDDAEVQLHPKGGGGTAFQPALDVFNEDPPACVIYFTDLYGSAPQEPDYPVLWAVPEASNKDVPPFGDIVRLSKYQ